MELLLSVGIQRNVRAVYLPTGHCDCVNSYQVPVTSVYVHDLGKFPAHFLMTAVVSMCKCQ